MGSKIGRAGQASNYEGQACEKQNQVPAVSVPRLMELILASLGLHYIVSFSPRELETFAVLPSFKKNG